MAQFDIYRNMNTATNQTFPYLLDIQNDLLSMLHSRVVVPLAVGVTPVRHLNPVFEIDGNKYIMSTTEIASVPLSMCSEKVTNISHERETIIDALDFMINGF